MKPTIVFSLIFLLSAGCKKSTVQTEPNPVVNTTDTTEVDTSDPTAPPAPTSDYRSAFTGNFLVNYYKKKSYMNTTQDSVNAIYTLHVDYNINDSVSYKNYSAQFFFPKISFFLNNAFLIGFGIEPNGEATLKIFDPNAGGDIIFQSGGFITADSINYTYSVSNPKTPMIIKVVGHRVP